MTKFYATMLSFIAAPKKDEKGATAVEYGLLVALIAGVLIAAITLIGTDLRTAFEAVVTAIPGGGA